MSMSPQAEMAKKIMASRRFLGSTAAWREVMPAVMKNPAATASLKNCDSRST